MHDADKFVPLGGLDEMLHMTASATDPAKRPPASSNATDRVVLLLDEVAKEQHDDADHQHECSQREPEVVFEAGGAECSGP